MPRFCVVIPSYNQAETLKEAIESALAQRHHDFSVVVSDNASQDNSAEVISQFDDPRLSAHVHSENLPKSANWNRAYRLAPDCEYLVTLHSDDRLGPQCLGFIDRASNGAPGVIYGQLKPLSFHGVSGRRIGFPVSHDASARQQHELYLLAHTVPVVGVAIRRDIFDELGGWPEEWTFMQDIEMWWRAAVRGRTHFEAAWFGYYRDPPPSKAREPFYAEQLEWFTAKAQIATESRLISAAHLTINDILLRHSRSLQNHSELGDRFRFALQEAEALLGAPPRKRHGRRLRQWSLRMQLAAPSIRTKDVQESA